MDTLRTAELVLSAQSGNRGAREALIEAHRAFILKQATRVTGRFLQWGEDDELSVALMAFDEAISQFDPSRGAFLPFAGQVIRSRLLDYYRKEKRYQEAISPLETVADEEGHERYPFEYAEATERYEKAQEQKTLAEEIGLFVAELAKYGIRLPELARSSPKHREKKQALLKVARALLERPDLCERLKRTRQLPIQELQMTTGVSRKVIESGRRYIVAVAIVHLHPELEHIRSYIQIPELKGV